MYRRKYQKGKETPDPTGTTQGEKREQMSAEDRANAAIPPHMKERFGRQQALEGMGVRGDISPNMNSKEATKAAVINRLMNSKDQQMQMQQALQQQQMMEQLKLMQVRNQMLEQQNQLLNTKIQKDEMINQARTIPSNLQKAITSPKKRGGSTKYGKGGAKRKGKTIIMSSNMGGVMKKGGQCGLPGGRHDRKR